MIIPTFFDILREREPDELINIASAWGVDLPDPHGVQAYRRLAAAIADTTLLEEVFNTLPAAIQAALVGLAQRGGKMPWEHFAAQYGEIRIIGASRRMKIRPDENPASLGEALWYKGLIGKAFLPTSDQSIEYVVLPQELLSLPVLSQFKTSASDVSKAAKSHTKDKVFYTGTSFVDHLCTFLAWQRSAASPASLSAHLPSVSSTFLDALVAETSAKENQQTPSAQAIKSLLEKPRTETLALLFQTWRASSRINEIRDNPYFTYGGVWQLNVSAIRTFVLEVLLKAGIKPVRIDDFIASIRVEYPNFLRKAGEYDSRLITDRLTSQPLRGIESWMQVEGRFLRYMLTGPLYYFGLLRLFGDSPDTSAFFQVHPTAARLVFDGIIGIEPTPSEKLSVNSEGIISISPSVPLSVRYHIARFCEWLPMKAGNYRYRPTPLSLRKAYKNGLRIAALLNLLNTHSRNPIPPAIQAALQNWEAAGSSARLENATLLRINDPALLDRLVQSPAGKNIIERINPHVIIINANAIHHIRRTLAEFGTLLEEPPAYNDQ